jgi:aspartyl-tRNA(Asn)/glutamyl-tRNA(Gln) amidotransferase subunit C
MAMKLTKKDVFHVAKLAKLNLSVPEQKKFEKQLSEVIHYVSELNEVDTKNVEPTSQTTGLVNVLRRDSQKSESLPVEAVMSGTEKTYNNYFVVPQLVSKEE